MSYHRFTNPREVLQGDVQGKIMHGIESEEYIDEECNCHGNKTGKCNYDDMCRHKMIVLYTKTPAKTPANATSATPHRTTKLEWGNTTAKLETGCC